jgi:hypothetical protein
MSILILVACNEILRLGMKIEFHQDRNCNCYSKLAMMSIDQNDLKSLDICLKKMESIVVERSVRKEKVKILSLKRFLQSKNSNLQSFHLLS